MRGLKKGDGVSGGKERKTDNIDTHMSEEVDVDVLEDGQKGDKNDIGDIHSSGHLRSVVDDREQKNKYSVKLARGERTECVLLLVCQIKTIKNIQRKRRPSARFDSKCHQVETEVMTSVNRPGKLHR